MTPYIADSDFVLYVGDALEVVHELPDESVHCCVTSPPYYGLRDYGTASWAGGDESCDHLTPHGAEGWKQITNVGSWQTRYRAECRRCGAKRVDAQLGLEATPAEYVARLVELFGEVRRVLRSDGTLWLNLGDSYATMRNDHEGGGFRMDRETGDGTAPKRGWHGGPGMKPKDLCGIPWRVAFALQAEGWFLRSDVIWSKPNPMPESVTDRPTKSHEYLFMLTRSARYYFAQDAVREQYAPASAGRYAYSFGGQAAETLAEHGSGRTRPIGERDLGEGRNVRSVWTFPTAPLPDAHFATYPIELPRRCIAASCPEGGTVLDPFMGSGTTALAARGLGRAAIGVELNPEYAALCARRTQQLSMAPAQLQLALA